ncbi:MAG: heme-copper oxidase subunit III [Thermoanaerobaculales bacterium]
MTRKRGKEPLPTFTTERIPVRTPATPATEHVDATAETTSYGRFGMWLFLASLSMLFAGCMVGYLVVRLRAPEWPPPGSPTLPPGLWLSTAVLGVLSVVLLLAQRAAREGRREILTRTLTASVLLAIAFLGAQVANWMRMVAADNFPQQSLFTFGFFILTFLHALHVLGGLVPLILVAVRARRHRYTATGNEGVQLMAMYWHFLAFVWLTILAVLSF